MERKSEYYNHRRSCIVIWFRTKNKGEGPRDESNTNSTYLHPKFVVCSSMHCGVYVDGAIVPCH